MEIESIGILSVATNKYINYWEDLAKSIDSSAHSNKTHVKLYVFTDQPERVNQFASTLQEITVKAFSIPSYKWPEATLYRYRIFEQFLPQIHEKILMHLDADMQVIRWFTDAIPNQLEKGIGLVSHPGYFRPKSLSKIIFYANNFPQLLGDLVMRIREGGIGSWDRNSQSSAYVPRRKRKSYVCGGTWLGRRDAFVAMVSDLSKLEKESTKAGIMPRWHDESILNKWFADHRPTLLSPAFCFDPTYPQLNGIEELIRAVDKGKIQR